MPKKYSTMEVNKVFLEITYKDKYIANNFTIEIVCKLFNLET